MKAGVRELAFLNPILYDVRKRYRSWERKIMAGNSWVFVKASWKGGTKFVIENRSGSKATIMARVHADETLHPFSPVETFIASLAACAGTNVVLLLEDGGFTVRSLIVKAECIHGAGEPRTFEKIHLIFLVSGGMDEPTVQNAINRSMTLVCPIAVTIGKSTDVTWECQIMQK